MLSGKAYSVCLPDVAGATEISWFQTEEHGSQVRSGQPSEKCGKAAMGISHGGMANFLRDLGSEVQRQSGGEFDHQSISAAEAKRL